MLNIVYWVLTFFREVKDITLEGTASQIFYSGPSFDFIRKQWETLMGPTKNQWRSAIILSFSCDPRSQS